MFKVPLCHLFSSLFNASSTRYSIIADNYHGGSYLSLQWFLGIDLDLISREQNFGRLLEELLHPFNLLESPDRLRWVEGDDHFTVKNYY